MVLKRVHMYDINHHCNMPIMFIDLKKKNELATRFSRAFLQWNKKKIRLAII